MRPLADHRELVVGAVLWHPAFGLTRVTSVDADGAWLDWVKPAENLPSRVPADGLVRAYALCNEGGLFFRAANSLASLRELAQVDPSEVLWLALNDLDGPQARSDIREWMTGLDVLPEATFDRWWQRLVALATADLRFRADGDLISLRDAEAGDLHARLEDASLSPARRLDLALQHRAALGEVDFRKHALNAWRAGNARVRDLAMNALAGVPADDVLSELVGPGPEALEAVIHALRHAEWVPERVSPATIRRLIDRCVKPTSGTEPLAPEGRLAAALWRWGAPSVEEAIAEAAAGPRAADLLEATLFALPPRRAENLAANLFRILPADADAARRSIARWLGEHADDGPLVLIDRLRKENPALADAVRASIQVAPSRDDVTLDSEEAPRTTEILPAAQQPSRLSEFPPLVTRELLRVGLGLAGALRDAHVIGRIVAPTVHGILVHADGQVEFTHQVGDLKSAARPPGEPEGAPADVYASGVALIEAILGKPWPRPLSADRALPFLRHIAPSLPPSALGPLAAVVDPHVNNRIDAQTWETRWRASLDAEAARATAYEPKARLRVGYDTHIGRMKVLHSQTNQDALYVATKSTQSLMVVCDGISTANTGSGDLAAGISAQVIASLWEQALPRLVHGRAEDAHDFLDRALRTANQAVCEASLRLAGGKLDNRVPMGSTAVVAVGQGNRISLAWLGDSRAYVVGKYGAAQLTADANQAGERIVDWQRGQLAQFDATGFALVRYIGHFNESGQAEPIPPLHTEIVLLPGERLVMCSDGVTDYCATGPAEVARVFTDVVLRADVDSVARALVELANRGGGGDNATAIVAAVV